MKKIVILGAGTGGTLVSNLLSRKLDMKEWEIIIIDKSDTHFYQPGFLFLPFELYGYHKESDVMKPIKKPLPDKARFVSATIQNINHEKKVVETSSGNFEYDFLVMSMGCSAETSEMEGLDDAIEKGVADTFYNVKGAMNLQKQIGNMKEGKLVLNLAEMPIKCPVAPIEFVFLADYFFHEKKIRDRVEIIYVTSLGGAFTKPQANEVLSKVIAEKGIKVIPNFNVESVDGDKKQLKSFNGETVDFDVLASIPPNLGPQVIEDSGLGDGNSFAVTDPKTLEAKKGDSIYVIGDNSNVSTSKAGSVAHFEAEVVVENILREIKGEKPIPDFDGHSNCFIESGFHKAFLIDFNYEVEPLKGNFPVPGVGPFSLLEESTLNHWGKMAFKWVYWNLLLTGHLPGDPLLPSHMSLKGKKIPESMASH
ncbi:MAG: NAD(P)/FAD-dependent oxidoreductase [Spirochaetia bacterium]|nr:NAD(P)/FAD-dependent oxidoreductase [Spirochaetia bacterium]